MEMLGEVNINPLPPFGNENDCGDKVEEGEEGDEGDEEEDDGVVEVTADGSRKKRRANNYTEIEDATLCRAWASVGMDAVSGTDQTGKRYWQRIEDKFHKLMPRVRHPVDRTYRSLQGRWDAIKPACSRWAAKAKAKLEEMRIDVKKAKATKLLLAEEREIMMMNTKEMNEVHMEWWKEASTEITARRRAARQQATAAADVPPGGGADVTPGGTADGADGGTAYV
jgi:hypothetical protein